MNNNNIKTRKNKYLSRDELKRKANMGSTKTWNTDVAGELV